MTRQAKMARKKRLFDYAVLVGVAIVLAYLMVRALFG